MTKVVPNNALTSYWELWKFFKQLTSEEKQGSVIFPVTNAEGTNELTLNLSEWAHTFPETDESGPKVSPTLSLARHVDFNGWTFRITGKLPDDAPEEPYLLYLAKSGSNLPQLFLSKEAIDSGDFTHVPELNTGTKLLFVKDLNRWTTRSGVNHYREDILLVKNGRAVNSVIAPYSTCTSYPQCTYIDAEDESTGGSTYELKNLKVVREATCQDLTNVLLVNNLNDVAISNVEVITETNSYLTENDKCFRIFNSTNVKITNVRIDNTYSDEFKSGYGFLVNNVWNLQLDGIIATSPVWGVFGNNFINCATLTNCSINRFDIHCYGKNVVAKDCIFQNNNLGSYHAMNRFSSIYGHIRFEGCTFNDFRPVRIDHDYNAFHGFDLFLKDCTMVLTKNSYNCIVEVGLLDGIINPRLELRDKALPNVIVEGELFVRVSEGVSNLKIFNLSADVGYLNGIAYMSLLTFPATKWLDADGNALSDGAKSGLTLYGSNRAITLGQPLSTNLISQNGGVQVVRNISAPAT